MDKIFLFDLDSTITCGEILPTIAKEIGKEKEMQFLTDDCMKNDIPFDIGLKKRMKIIKNIRVSLIKDVILNIPLNNRLVDFIKKYKNQCYIVSGSVNIFIESLMKKIGFENNYFSSKATVKNDLIDNIYYIIKKSEVVDYFRNQNDNLQIIAIGDGSNDVEMVREADIGIAFGGVRQLAPSLEKVADYITLSESELYNLLNKIVNE